MRILIAILVVLGLFPALEHRAAPPAIDSPLRVFERFVGPTWTASFPGGKVTDTQSFEWMCGEKFVRNPHQVRDLDGKVVYEGETIYGWDAQAKRIAWWYFNSTGGWIEGRAEEGAAGELLFEGENHAGGEQTERVKSSSRMDDQGRWLVTTWFWSEGTWKPERELVYSKKP